MIADIIFPFATVLSAYGWGFDVFLGTEGGIARYNTSANSVEWKYPFPGRVEHIAFNNGNVIFYSGGKLYYVPGGSSPLSRPFEIASVENPGRIGISRDGLIVLDYGGRFRVMDLGGIERNVNPENVNWGASWRDNSIEREPGIRNLPLYNPALGRVMPLFLLSLNGRWYVGTDGLGLLIMNRGSLFPDDTVMDGTLNSQYRYMTSVKGKIYIAGNRGIDIIDSRMNFLTVSGCSRGADYVFGLKGDIYAAGCGRIYRIYENGMSIDITGNIGYDRIKETGGRVFIFYRGDLYEFTGKKISLKVKEETYDVFSLGRRIYAITNRGIMDVDGGDEIPFDKKSWLDRFTRADSQEDRVAICTRFGILIYDGNRWMEFQNSLGNIADCKIRGERVMVVSQDHLLRILYVQENSWDMPFQGIGDIQQVETRYDTLYISSGRAIFKALIR